MVLTNISHPFAVLCYPENPSNQNLSNHIKFEGFGSVFSERLVTQGNVFQGNSLEGCDNVFPILDHCQKHGLNLQIVHQSPPMNEFPEICISEGRISSPFSSGSDCFFLDTERFGIYPGNILAIRLHSPEKFSVEITAQKISKLTEFQLRFINGYLANNDGLSLDAKRWMIEYTKVMLYNCDISVLNSTLAVKDDAAKHVSWDLENYTSFFYYSRHKSTVDRMDLSLYKNSSLSEDAKVFLDEWLWLRGLPNCQDQAVISIDEFFKGKIVMRYKKFDFIIDYQNFEPNSFMKMANEIRKGN